MKKICTILAAIAVTALILSCSSPLSGKKSGSSSDSALKAASITVKLSPLNPVVSAAVLKGKAKTAATALAKPSSASGKTPRTADASSRAFIVATMARLEIFASGDTSFQKALDSWDVDLTSPYPMTGGDGSSSLESSHALPTTILDTATGIYTGVLRVTIYNGNNGSGSEETVQGSAAISVASGTTDSSVQVTCFPVGAVALSAGTSAGPYILPTAFVSGDGAPSAYGSEKWFSFTGSSTGFSQMTVTPVSEGTEKFSFYIFDGISGTVFSGDNHSIQAVNASATASMTFPTEAGKSYYCAVIEYETAAASPRNLGFSIKSEECSNPDLPSNVSAVTIGTPVSSTLSAGGSVWFSFDGVAGTTYHIQTYAIEGSVETPVPSPFTSLDTVIYLYNDGDYSGKIDSDDDGLGGSGNFSLIADFLCPTTRKYYVKVVGYSDGDLTIDSTESGPFHFLVAEGAVSGGSGGSGCGC